MYPRLFLFFEIFKINRIAVIIKEKIFQLMSLGLPFVFDAVF